MSGFLIGGGCWVEGMKDAVTRSSACLRTRSKLSGRSLILRSRGLMYSAVWERKGYLARSCLVSMAVESMGLLYFYAWG